jgi:ABC-type nitrate/sulfonate/bicarbonate transport system substrate-binding protein
VAGQAQGLFEARGLTLEVTTTGSSVRQLQGLRDGTYDIGLQLADHVVRATQEGCPMVVLAAQSHAPDVPLMARADVAGEGGKAGGIKGGTAGLMALKGRPVGVDGARSGYALLLTRLLRASGFSEADVRLVEVGGTQERADALRRGEVAAAFVNPPLDRPLAAEGFVRLTGTREAFPDYPGPVVACRRAWAEAHPQEAAALQVAWADAWSWLLDPAHEAQAVALAVQHFNAAPEAAQQMLQRLRAQGLPRVSGADLEGVAGLMGSRAGTAAVSAAALLWPAPAG